MESLQAEGQHSLLWVYHCGIYAGQQEALEQGSGAFSSSSRFEIWP